MLSSILSRKADTVHHRATHQCWSGCDGPSVRMQGESCALRLAPHETGQDFLPNHMADGIDFAFMHL